MNAYKVTWAIEVEAESDFDAANLAEKIMSNPTHRFSIANARKFVVTQIGIIDTTFVNLSDEDVVDFHNVTNG
jgi:hypothetical protein